MFPRTNAMALEYSAALRDQLRRASRSDPSYNAASLPYVVRGKKQLIPRRLRPAGSNTALIIGAVFFPWL